MMHAADGQTRQSPNNSTNRPAAADGTLGMALMSAVVTYTGDLVRGSGVSAISNPNLGEYVLTFDRDISQCTWVVSAAAEGDFAIADFGPNNGFGPNQLAVFVRSITGASSNSVSYAADRSDFNLIVFCSQ